MIEDCSRAASVLLMSASAVNKFVHRKLTIRLVSSLLSGRHFLHNAVNNLIKRAMTSTETPAVLKPASRSYSDGKIPDGLTIVPWTRGRCLEWDFTRSDTLATSHLSTAVVGPGTANSDVRNNKKSKHSM